MTLPDRNSSAWLKFAGMWRMACIASCLRKCFMGYTGRPVACWLVAYDGG